MKPITQKTFIKILVGKVTSFFRNRASRKKTIPPFEKHLSNEPETQHVYTRGANSTFLFTRSTQPRISLGFRAIKTQSDLSRISWKPILCYTSFYVFSSYDFEGNVPLLNVMIITLCPPNQHAKTTT